MDREKNEAPRGIFRADRRESAVDRVISAVKDALISGKLVPGDRLPSEIQLGESLSISRGTIREAMKILSAFGVVEIRQGDGTYISRSDDRAIFEPLLFSLVLSKENMKELVELRELLEVAIVKLILENARSEDLEAVERALLDLEEKVRHGERRPSELALADISFHRTLGYATGNRMVEKIYHFVIDFFAPSIELSHRKQEKGVLAKEHHRKIYDALAARDLESAVRAIRESIGVWKNYMQDSAKGDPQSARSASASPDVKRDGAA
jgi:DNA-binding FadR family transcriptional regulator